jgi:hypothetical protein
MSTASPRHPRLTRAGSVHAGSVRTGSVHTGSSPGSKDRRDGPRIEARAKVEKRGIAMFPSEGSPNTSRLVDRSGMREGNFETHFGKDTLETSSQVSSRPATRRRRGRANIAKPKALTGSSYLTAWLTFVHYAIIGFLFMSGRYYNDAPPPLLLFIIPSFVAAAATTVGLLCLVMQGRWIVRTMCSPSTGIKISILGIFGCASWSLVLYGPLHNDYTQAIQLYCTGGIMTIYYLLVRRRLSFASIVFSEGAKSVSRLKALWFRILLHALFLLVYAAGWSILYLQLIRLVSISEDASPAQNATLAQNSTSSYGAQNVTRTSHTHNSTGLQAENLTSTQEILAGLSAGATLIPAWLTGQIIQGTIRIAAQAFLVYNFMVVSQAVKGSMWLSVSASAACICLAARKGGPVRLRTSAQLNSKLREILPSLAVSGHVQLLCSALRCICEGIRRCRSKRAGILYNLGALLCTIIKPIVSRMNLLGLCSAGTRDGNIVYTSQRTWFELEAVGLMAVVNDDALFGTRICSSVLFASVSGVVGRILVEIFIFPLSLVHEMEFVCFILVFFIGNIGVEAGEAWSMSLYLEFLQSPEAVYVSNPVFASAVHSVLFGLPLKEVKKKGGRDSQNKDQLQDNSIDIHHHHHDHSSSMHGLSEGSHHNKRVSYRDDTDHDISMHAVSEDGNYDQNNNIMHGASER